MIYFLNTNRNKHPLRHFLESHGAALTGRIVPVCYEQLLAAAEVPLAAYIFSDIELLSEEQRQRAAEIWRQLSERGCPLLNHPSKTMRRYELLRMLHGRGVNRFNVYRARDAEMPQRFPVFLRRENDHHGSLTRLLRSPAELASALRWRRWFGPRLDELLITEFCETADGCGVYRKYSAFNVGGQILPRHLFFSQHWLVKSWQLSDERFKREEMEYVESTRHESQLREIFTAAHVDYGRMDYSLLDGQIQVWEINTNPMIVASGKGNGGARSQLHATFAARICQAFEKWEADGLTEKPRSSLNPPHFTRALSQPRRPFAAS